MMKLIIELVFIGCCSGLVNGYMVERATEKANKKMPPVKAA